MADGSIEYTADGKLRLEVRDGCLWLGPVLYADEARRAALVDGKVCPAVHYGVEGYVAPEPERITDEDFELLERQLAVALDRYHAARLRRVS